MAMAERVRRFPVAEPTEEEEPQVADKDAVLTHYTHENEKAKDIISPGAATGAAANTYAGGRMIFSSSSRARSGCVRLSQSSVSLYVEAFVVAMLWFGSWML